MKNTHEGYPVPHRVNDPYLDHFLAYLTKEISHFFSQSRTTKRNGTQGLNRGFVILFIVKLFLCVTSCVLAIEVLDFRQIILWWLVDYTSSFPKSIFICSTWHFRKCPSFNLEGYHMVRKGSVPKFPLCRQYYYCNMIQQTQFLISLKQTIKITVMLHLPCNKKWRAWKSLRTWFVAKDMSTTLQYFIVLQYFSHMFYLFKIPAASCYLEAAPTAIFFL